jgi:hypothetical protein
MKKNIFRVLVMLLALCCLIVGCDNPANSGEDEKNQTTNTEGWYAYTTEIRNTDGYYTQQTTIFYINTTGNILRAGSRIEEYSGTELAMLQQQFSWSICRNLADYSDGRITFVLADAPVWAEQSDDNSNDDLENEDGNENNPSSGDNNNNGETDIPSEDDKPEITLPTGYEWWCFEDAYLNNGRYENIYVLYCNGTAVKSGIDSFEFSKNNFLYEEKNTAISIYLGTYYQITDLTKLPSWAL